MKFFKPFLLTIILTCTIGFIYAQPPGDPGGGEDPDAVPIDGGISLLLAAGSLYGARKVYNYNKTKSIQ